MFVREEDFCWRGPGDMNDRTTLHQALAAARAGLQTQSPPPHVRAQLLAAFERQRFERAAAAPAQDVPPRATGGLRVLLSWGAVARWSGAVLSLALIAMAGLFVLGEPQAGSDATLAQADSSVFIPTVSSSRLAQETQGYVVTTEMPRASLASMGLPFDASRAADSVRAEMLMSRSGDILAVRFVN